MKVRDYLIEKKPDNPEKVVWTKKEANTFIRKHNQLWKRAGYKPKIVGSVASQGWSYKDLDIELHPTTSDYDFELIMSAFPGDFTHNMDTYEGNWKGKLVDFLFFESLQERKIWFDIYSNPKGETAEVYERSGGFYVEVDSKYDMDFPNEKKLNAWLKKGKWRHIGTDSISELFKTDVGVRVRPTSRKMKEKGSKTFRSSWFLNVGGEKNAEYFFEATYHYAHALPNLPKGFYNVSFGIQYAPEEFRDKVTDQFDLTGFGNATKVLSGVVDSFKKFVKRTNPEVFIYSAEKGSRVRLYDRFAKIIEKQYGYKYEKRPSRFRDMDFDWVFWKLLSEKLTLRAQGTHPGFDNTLLKALKIIDKKGYPTYSSHSGLEVDHGGEETSPSSYIAFIVTELTDEQMNKIKSAVKKPFEFHKISMNLIAVRLWVKVKNDPYSEDHPQSYIEKKWIEFAKRL